MPSPATKQNAALFRSASDDVFARIAGRYDFLCDVFSARIHRLWKSRMAARIADHPAGLVLDVASGTGDIPQRVRRILVSRSGKQQARKLVVSDICPEMLAVAKTKLGTDDPLLAYQVLDAHRLDEIESNSIDLYSISFAMKICDRESVLSEAMRVLKPGGVFFCLEAARIPSPPLHWTYLQYMNWCLPLIGWFAAGGDRSAYGYLLRGIHEFPAQAVFAEEFETLGFTDVSFENLTFGIVALHQGRKP